MLMAFISTIILGLILEEIIFWEQTCDKIERCTIHERKNKWARTAALTGLFHCRGWKGSSSSCSCVQLCRAADNVQGR